MTALIKKIYLDYIRLFIFGILFVFAGGLRKKKLEPSKVKRIIIIGQNRIGDNIATIPTLKNLRYNFPGAEIVIVANRYVRDILEIEGSANKIMLFRNENIKGKLNTLRCLMTQKWDLGIDLTCEYEFWPALLLILSRAGFRVGYNVKKRGFLFHRPVEWQKAKKHYIERLLDLLRTIDLKITSNKALLLVPDALKNKAKDFLKNQGINDGDIIIGIHPGGHHPTQRWGLDRFAQTADELINRYKAKIIIMDSDKELINKITSMIKGEVIKVDNLPLNDLIGIISNCRLIICNNSGILHLASAIGVPTVSTMGPTLSWRWWPQGEKNIVLMKELDCLSCEKAYCDNHRCMELITVNEMLEAVDKQIKRAS